MKKLFLIAIVAILFAACKKDEIANMRGLPPNTFYFQLLKADGNFLTGIELDSLKLFYIDKNGTKQYQNPDTLMDFPQFMFKPSLLASEDIVLDEYGILKARDVNGFGTILSNVWFFEQIDGNIDTLYVESKNISFEEGIQDPCMCNFPFTVMRFNGKEVLEHPTLRSVLDRPVYVLKP